MSPQDRMTLEEMAELTGWNPRTIQKKSWRDENNFPANRMGKTITGYRPLIEKWIIDRTNGRN